MYRVFREIPKLNGVDRMGRALSVAWPGIFGTDLMPVPVRFCHAKGEIDGKHACALSNISYAGEAIAMEEIYESIKTAFAKPAL